MPPAFHGTAVSLSLPDSPVPGHRSRVPQAASSNGRRAPAHGHERAAAGRRGAQAAGGCLALGEQHGQRQAGGGEEPVGPGRVVAAVYVYVPADVPSWLVSRGGRARLWSSPLRRSAGDVASRAANTSRSATAAWRSSARSAAEISMGSGSPYFEHRDQLGPSRGAPGPGSSMASRSAARCAASCTLLPSTGS